MFEMFKSNLNMFLDLQGSCSKKKSKLRKNCFLNCGLRFLPEWLSMALGSFEDINLIHIFKTFKNKFKNFPTAKTRTNLRPHFNIKLFSSVKFSCNPRTLKV